MFVDAKSAVLLLCAVGFCVTTSPASIVEQYPVKRVTSKQYYPYGNRAVTFFEAWRLCQVIGFGLATITNQEDSRLIEKAIQATSNPKGPWWIAGTDFGSQGMYVWITTNQQVGYGTGFFNYAALQPDNAGGTEHCLEIGRFGGAKWNDAPCDFKQGYVCENVL